MRGGRGEAHGMAALAADTVASLLRDGATRTAATLEAFEQHEGTPIDREVALAAAPALYDVLAMDGRDRGGPR